MVQMSSATVENPIDTMKSAKYVISGSPKDGPHECDLIMKGGLTSGVVYPLTICKLATKYRFRSIGGTSAGAIAAVMAAAAEFRRQTPGQSPGRRFPGTREAASRHLEEVGRALSAAAGNPRDVRGRARRDRGQGHGAIAWEVFRQQLGWFLGGVLLVLGVVLPGLVITTGFPIDGPGWLRIAVGLVLPLLLAVAVGLAAAALGFLRSALRILPRTDFGLTDGATYSGDPGKLTRR